MLRAAPRYEAPVSSAQAYSSSMLYTYSDCYEDAAPKAGGTSVSLALTPRQIAVIVWS